MSVINQLNKYIDENTKNLRFNITDTDKFDYSILQSRKNNVIYPTVNVDDKYLKVQMMLRVWSNKLNQIIKLAKEHSEEVNFDITYSLIYTDLIDVYSHGNYDSPKEKLVNTLIDIIYAQDESISNSQNVLWYCFGDVVVNNIKNNLQLNDYIPISKNRISQNNDLFEIKSKIDQKIEENQVYITINDVELINRVKNKNSKKLLFSLLVLSKLFGSNLIYLSEDKNSKLNKTKLSKMSGFPNQNFDSILNNLSQQEFISITNKDNKKIISLNTQKDTSKKIIMINNIWNCSIYYDFYFNHKPLERCIICGNDFIREVSTQRTCSEKCSKILESQRHKINYNIKNN